MTDEEVDLSEIPEITAQDLRGAVLRLGGKPVPEGKSFVGMLLDSCLLRLDALTVLAEAEVARIRAELAAAGVP